MLLQHPEKVTLFWKHKHFLPKKEQSKPSYNSSQYTDKVSEQAVDEKRPRKGKQ